jgi:hypothetical protein
METVLHLIVALVDLLAPSELPKLAAVQFTHPKFGKQWVLNMPAADGESSGCSCQFEAATSKQGSAVWIDTP